MTRLAACCDPPAHEALVECSFGLRDLEAANLETSDMETSE